MSIHYSATGADNQSYTITRETAGGGFTPRVDGVAIAPAGRLRHAREACRRHASHGLEWTDEVKSKYA